MLVDRLCLSTWSEKKGQDFSHHMHVIHEFFMQVEYLSSCMNPCVVHGYLFDDVSL